MNLLHELDENKSFVSVRSTEHTAGTGEPMPEKPVLHHCVGTCSTVARIVLEEAQVDYELQRLTLGPDGITERDYAQIHPFSRVPALTQPDGEVLTELAAILAHVVLGHTTLELPAPMRAREIEWHSGLFSYVHTPFRRFFRPQRCFPQPAPTAVLQSFREHARQQFHRGLTYFGHRIAGPYALGERFSTVDPYLYVMCHWGRATEFDFDEHPALRAHATRVEERAAVRSCLEDDGISTLWS
ncbi:MAG: glutathione S-transferase family protein [Myxococcales bacterium FL481]|nr:MAG: glutathione S-transferase family protein [Myxococcales bacterium FL481]